MTWLGWTITILFLLLRPSDGEMSWLQQIPHFDKVIHFTLFFIWAFLATLAIGNGRATNRHFLLVFVAVVVFAVMTEWLQLYVPSRTADWNDILADATGGLLGLVLTKFWKINQ
ncbi:VanZ family protein [Reichenbachiella agarivorans]|uniref:VanZ family protein n=1 Tax=Reichenbachiella agarivorans TaxID=2979464 RepID=A0ABY6CRX6_9BACT|nr:VanZ family protein [Reichenbachiella agarivorans]UXP33257.1 VanZ family protein [Reichenbachiella agarivorans]